MNKFVIICVFLSLFAFKVKAQEDFKPSGQGIGTIFLDYKYDLTKDVELKSTFELERAYLGYKYDFAKNISAKVVFDAGYDGKAFGVFAKFAQLDWAIFPKLKLTAGMFALKQFDTQEKFWNYRYITKPAVDMYGLGVSADMGVNIELPVHEKVTFNISLLNGEGFKSLQDKYGLHKVAANVVIKPIDGLVAKVYYDIMPGKDKLDPADTTTISGLNVFLGYEMKEKFRIGVEYNSITNGKTYKQYADGYNLSNISVVGAFTINSKFELFARYDMLKSNKLSGATNDWNYNKDGQLIIGGIQYKPVKGINLALNYRTWLYENSDFDAISGIYLNMGINF